ncbi:hypothetical protein [Frateuria soli]|uniref:hypothetical protein n=1 Tax=Frateuria soli TaxID=1542730 RepID=UPI001E5EE68A|nr:hypothetical protein [Frateuria soli]UGB39121.1 hypothetical protein LQ771_04555 [Frateuria soli]
MTGDLDPQRRMYATPNAAELQAALPALAERIRTDLEALVFDPSPSRCDGVALTLYGAQTHVLRLRMATGAAAND